MRYGILIAVSLASAACGGGSHSFECTDNASCNLSGGGTCIAAPTGNSWCAYPDADCSSGYRYSEQDAGDGLAATCVPGNIYTLTVSIGGNATGTVTSAPDGISCSSGTCTAEFREGTLVDLTAMATTGSFLGWSDACSGTDTCTVTMDRDLTVGALFGIPGQALWAKQLGSNDQNGEYAGGIVIDGNGDLIVVGEFANTITPKAGIDLVSAGNNDIFVLKVSSATGDVVWAKRFGGIENDSAADVAVDAANAIYVTGSMQGTVNFGGGNLQAAAGDVFTLKLNADGSYGWARKVGSPDPDTGYAIAVSGNSVVVTGTFMGTLTVDTTSFTNAGNTDFFVHSMATSTGATNWVKAFGGASADWANELEIDGGGSVLVTGRFGGTVNFGGGALSAALLDAFILKLGGSNGAHQVSFRIGGAGVDDGTAIAVDPMNNFLVAGDFNGTADFGCASTLTASQADRNDLFLVKYTQAGSCLWVKGFGGTGGTGSYGPHAYGLATNPAGDIAMAGEFCGSVTFGGSTLSAPGSCPLTDVFAARFKSDGTHLNSVRAGGTGEEHTASVAQALDGRFFATGSFQGFAEFGGDAFTSSGYTDVFILALSPL